MMASIPSKGGPSPQVNPDTRPKSLPMPTRNPVPLSASQEAQVTEIYHKRVRNKCADEIRDFAACAIHRTISATWACRVERLAMNACMVRHATEAEHDAAREEWFATREQRKLEKEAKERKRQVQEKLHRDWWGLPEQGAGRVGERYQQQESGGKR
ncbi:MAG: hypothetical protein M1834_005871 [Cirrosporium novae-zelandiae]|nr:MAG: hypothetical protein M1834_005871 [Cirrosporium novae-zelandiae]